MSIVRNVLAVIGAATVARHAVKFFHDHISKPLSEAVADVIDAEYARDERKHFADPPAP